MYCSEGDRCLSPGFPPGGFCLFPLREGNECDLAPVTVCFLPDIVTVPVTWTGLSAVIGGSVMLTSAEDDEDEEEEEDEDVARMKGERSLLSSRSKSGRSLSALRTKVSKDRDDSMQKWPESSGCWEIMEDKDDDDDEEEGEGSMRVREMSLWMRIWARDESHRVSSASEGVFF